MFVQEEDQKLLARLAEQEAQDQHIQSARRKKAQADAAWMKKVNNVCLIPNSITPTLQLLPKLPRGESRGHKA